MRMILDNPVQAMETNVFAFIHPQFNFTSAGVPVSGAPHKTEVLFLFLVLYFFFFFVINMYKYVSSPKWQMCIRTHRYHTKGN